MTAQNADSVPESRCPSCDRLCQVWSDGSVLTVNFACDWPDCEAGKGPWDTPRPEPDPAVSGPHALPNWLREQNDGSVRCPSCGHRDPTHYVGIYGDRPCRDPWHGQNDGSNHGN